jgi:hypothetical protein
MKRCNFSNYLLLKVLIPNSRARSFVVEKAKKEVIEKSGLSAFSQSSWLRT